MKKMILSVLFSVAFLVIPLNALAEEVINLGLVTPLSAPGDTIAGNINVNTAELAVAELNAKGGILGKKVVLHKADDEGKPAVGVTAVKRLITDKKVSAIVGPWHSSVTLAEAKVCDSYGVPFILHYSWSDKLTEGHSKYVFRIGPYNTEVATKMQPFFLEQGYKTIAIIYETTSTGITMADSLATQAEANGIKVYKVAYPAEAIDLTPQLLELKAKKPYPEMLFVKAVYQAMYLIPKQAVEIGLSPKTELLISWDYPGWSPKWWEILGEKGVGPMYSTFMSDRLKLSPSGEHFKNAFSKKFGMEAPIYAYYLYDAVMMVADAMERAKSSDPKKIAETLKTAKFDGTTGVISFESREGPGPIWNQWLGHQVFIKKLTAFKQKGKDAPVVWPK